MIKEDIYTAKDGKLLRNCNDTELKKLIYEITIELGSPDHENKEELEILKNSLKNTYGHFTVQEIKLAIKFKQQGVIQADTETFGRPVNPSIISRLTTAYRALKSETLVKYGRFSPDPEIPEDEKEGILIQGVRRIYSEWLKDETYLINRMFVFSPYVNCLKRHGKITISETDKIEARKTAEEIVPQMQLKKTIVSRIIKPDQSDIQKYMDYYYLFMYFHSCKILNKQPI